jgi:AcrR family transcriptional regulator
LTKEEVLDRLLTTFREKGYDGASLAELSTTTGLGKSSLYHHFPGGKADMAEQVLEHLEAALERTLFVPLRSKASPDKKLAAMLDTIAAFYENGRRACLLERLCASAESRQFRRPLANAFAKWIGAAEALARESGLPKATARARAEELVVRVEGALVVAAGTGDTKIFERTTRDLRGSLLRHERHERSS